MAIDTDLMVICRLFVCGCEIINEEKRAEKIKKFPAQSKIRQEKSDFDFI